MREEAPSLSRRDLVKVGAAAAGAILLQPAAMYFVDGGSGAADRKRILPLAEKSTDFPTSLRPAKLKQPNIVLIILDTVRADHLSCYGYHRETTPNIDAFARGSRVYKNVLSPGPYTLPSHVSLFTGLANSAHGASWGHRYLDERFVTLAEQLRAGGYQTAAITANSVFVTRECGFDKGFETFENPSEISASGSDLDVRTQTAARDGLVTKATAVNGRAATWFRERYDAQKPFFLFLNYMDAHQPYACVLPSESLRFSSTAAWKKWMNEGNLWGILASHALTGLDLLSSRDIADLESLYDDAIQHVDSKLGEVLAFLKTNGLDENTCVFITSDHGEHFGEHHMMDHQFSLYEPVVRVPLIARYADRFPIGVEEKLVQMHDIYPTVLELAGLEWRRRPGQTCQSLLQPLSVARCGISEYLVPMPSALESVTLFFRQVDCARFFRAIRAIQRENMKLIHSSRGELELYNLADDPMETRNLAAQKPEVTRDLMGALNAWRTSFDSYVAQSSLRTVEKTVLSPESLQEMRGLGYLH